MKNTDNRKLVFFWQCGSIIRGCCNFLGINGHETTVSILGDATLVGVVASLFRLYDGLSIVFLQQKKPRLIARLNILGIWDKSATYLVRSLALILSFFAAFFVSFFSSLISDALTNSIIAMGAESPLRKPVFRMRVYPPFRS